MWYEIIIMMSPCRKYSKKPNIPLKYICVYRKGIWTTYDIIVWVPSAFLVGRLWGCCKACCFWLPSNSLVKRVSVPMPSLICIGCARVGSPWDKLSSPSVSRCQPWKSADDHTFTWPAVWTWDFTSESTAWVVTQGFQCIAEHQLCWTSSLLLWCNALPELYILHVALLSGQSSNTSRGFGAHLPSCLRSIQLAHSVLSPFSFQYGRYLVTIAVWQVSVRIWCD